MNIQEIILVISSMKPTRDEIINSYNGSIDSQYVDDLLDSFDVSCEINCQRKYLIQNIIECTTIGKVDFGGISFSSRIEKLNIGECKYLKFGSYQENILAVSEDFNFFFLIDFYDANNEQILYKVPLVQENFIKALLLLLKFDIDFKYRKYFVNESDIRKLSEVAGDQLYFNFFNLICSQYTV